MSIVKKENLQKPYEDKINLYEWIIRKTKDKYHLNYSRVIPMIITVEWIIHEKTVQAIKEIELKVN